MSKLTSENKDLKKRTNQEENDIRQKQNASFIGSSNDPFSNPKRDNYQTYPYDYFAGCDCKVFFGDIWVDDIVAINYNVSQSKTPIFGYASQNFDAIAKGQVIIQGTLAISFKETGYLNIIQATLEAQKKRITSGIDKKIKQYKDDANHNTFIPGINYIGDSSNMAPVNVSYSATGNPQIIRQQQTIEQILTSKKAGTALSSELNLQDKSRDFEDFAEVLEDSIWGDSNGHPIELENQLKRADEFDYSSNGGIITAKNRSYSDVLNIMLTFGDINDYRAEHTIIVLNDVHFTSNSAMINPDGAPIAEEYTFIARDINKSINTKSTNINPIKLDVGNDNIKLSKLSDVEAIEQFLNNSSSQATLTFEAALTPNGWAAYTGKIIETFSSNKINPFVDQVCQFVENTINTSYVPEIVDTNNTQYIIKINTTGFTDNELTMIIQQTIPGTRSYKVISPTRSGFASTTIITRDDILTGELPRPIQERSIVSPTQEQKAKQKEADSVSVASVSEEIFIPPEPGYSAETISKINNAKQIPDKNRKISQLDIKQVQDRYGSLIAQANRDLGGKLPLEFYASIISTESAGNPNIVSSKGAEGLAQFTLPTYAESIQRINKEHPEIKLTPIVGAYSPKNAIYALVEHTNYLYNKTGSLELVAASYNGGLGSIKQSKDDPNYKIYQNPVNTGYDETRKYVPKVITGYNILSEYNKNLPINDEDNIINDREKAKRIYKEQQTNNYTNISLN